MFERIFLILCPGSQVCTHRWLSAECARSLQLSIWVYCPATKFSVIILLNRSLLSYKNKAIGLPLCPRSVLPPPAFLHESTGRTPCLHRRRTRCQHSQLRFTIPSACTVSHAGTKLGTAWTHGSCAAHCCHPRCCASPPIPQWRTGGASPSQKSSCSSDDPTCTYVIITWIHVCVNILIEMDHHHETFEISKHLLV
jgi:hypothetical protein